jgi:hypothetical protein
MPLSELTSLRSSVPFGTNPVNCGCPDRAAPQYPELVSERLDSLVVWVEIAS